MEKVLRTEGELIKALQDQLHILKEAIERVKTGDFAYTKVIAASLRVLVLKTTKNKPLLLNLAKKYDFPLIITRDVPPFKPATISIQDLLDELYFASGTEHVKITKRELIAKSAQQEGLSHEDESLDKDYLISKPKGLYIGGLPPDVRALLGLGQCIYQAGNNLLVKLLG